MVVSRQHATHDDIMEEGVWQLSNNNDEEGMVGERQKEGEGMTKEEEEARMVVATIREGREGKWLRSSGRSGW